MKGGPPILIMEPAPLPRLCATAEKLKQIGGLLPGQGEDLAEVKRRLREIREQAAESVDRLVEELSRTLATFYPGIKVKLAGDSREAVEYVTSVSGGSWVATNHSAVISRELRPGLEANGVKLVNSYFCEFQTKERGIADYWDLPRLTEKNLGFGFEVTRRLTGFLPRNGHQTSEYTALLGVNSVSASDGSVFFLQHFTNIYRDLEAARKVILVVGLDKIVGTAEEAAFQARCMGLFGAESMLFEVQPGAAPALPAERPEFPPSPSGRERELHVIILDNGRRELAKGKFRELFVCIGCRACNQRCPIRHSFTVNWVWTPRNYLKQFLDRAVRTIDVCLHCEGCRLSCPLEIDLPHLMWEAKLDYVKKHGVPFSHMILGRPELVAKAGSTAAPLSNLALRLRPVRLAMEFTAGIHRRVRMPEFAKETFAEWFSKAQQRGSE